MPTISTFYGIRISMNYNEHNPPHFHAEYQNYEITVDILTGSITGNMPRRALNLIWTWLDEHQTELLENWDRARQRQALSQIEPLA
ncbi:MAG: DUF4160 domain-containing protein [Anaerolineales bacterium]|nr:DUF4160 domain-containing protein [Anaerolineales bacterium]